MMRNLNCYPTRFKSWSLATASDGQNVTLAGGGSSLLPYRKPTPSGEPVRLIRPETAHACMTHETQKRPRLSYLRFEISILPITVPKSVRCSPLFGSVVLFKFDISFRILTIVLFRATLKYIFLLHVACLLVKSRVFRFLWWSRVFRCLCLAFEESLLITMFSKVARQEEDFPPKKKRKSFGYSEEWKIW